jgi:hypothetical protein
MQANSINAVIVLPIVMLVPMLMHSSQKFGLALVFSLVAIDIAFDILRTVYTTSVYFSQFPDQNAMWAILEPTIAVMVCALPVYRGLLSWHKPANSPTALGDYSSSDSSKFSKLFKQSISPTERPTSIPTELDEVKANSVHSEQRARHVV